jgi:DNA transposition AAA+ family ATPase
MMKDIGDGLQEFLDERARVLTVAWALPPSGQVRDEDMKAAMTNFREYCARNLIALGQVAREVGRPNEEAIGELLAGRFTADAERDVRMLNAWLEQHARRAITRKPGGFVSDTHVATEMMNAARLIVSTESIGLVIGPSGVGKTACAEVIAETVPGSIYLRITRESRNPRGFLSALADALHCRRNAGRSEREGARGTVGGRVFDRLSRSGRLVILDEAHQLSAVGLETVRDLHDSCAVPILLVSTVDLQERILRDADADHGQFYSRVAVVVHLTAGRDIFGGDKRPLFTKEQIRKLFEVTPIRLAPDATDYLQGVANQLGRGSLRRCAILLEFAARRARKRQGLAEFEEVTVSAVDLEVAEQCTRRDPVEEEMVADRRRRSAVVASA